MNAQVFKRLILLFSICTPACGYRQIDALKFIGNQYRCPEDGFCFYATGERSLQAGFREGEVEIRVDVVDAQVHRNDSAQNFAVLVSDHHENPLMLSDSGRVPGTWKVKHQSSHAVQNIGEFSSERDIREKLTFQLARNMERRSTAEGTERKDACLIAAQILKDMVERNDSFHRNETPGVPQKNKEIGISRQERPFVEAQKLLAFRIPSLWQP